MYMDPDIEQSLSPDTFEETGIEWNAPTHMHTERSADWYWALGILAICGTIASILWGNLLFAVIIALAALSIVLIAARTPREHTILLGERGVVVDEDFYPYRSLRSFWIAEHSSGTPKLILSTTGIIHPHIVVPLMTVEPEVICAHLEQYIPEEPGHSVSTYAAEFLGF